MNLSFIFTLNYSFDDLQLLTDIVLAISYESSEQFDFLLIRFVMYIGKYMIELLIKVKSDFNISVFMFQVLYNFLHHYSYKLNI